MVGRERGAQEVELLLLVGRDRVRRARLALAPRGDDERAARLEHAVYLAQCLQGVGGMMQDTEGRDHVEAIVFKRKMLGIGLPDVG